MERSEGVRNQCSAGQYMFSTGSSSLSTVLSELASHSYNCYFNVLKPLPHLSRSAEQMKLQKQMKGGEIPSPTNQYVGIYASHARQVMQS